MESMRKRVRADDTDGPPQKRSPRGEDGQPEGEIFPSGTNGQHDDGQRGALTRQGKIDDINDALAFVDEVKEYFKDIDPGKFSAFLGLLKGHKEEDGGFGIPCLISRLKELFKGHKEMIVRFNEIFLPRDKIIIVDDVPELQQLAKLYMAKIKERSIPLYTTFLHILYLHEEGAMVSDEVDKEVEWLFADQCDLLEEFEYFRPDERAAVPVVAESAPHPRHQDLRLSPSQRQQRSERLLRLCKELAVRKRRDKGKGLVDEYKPQPTGASASDAEKVSAKNLKLWSGELRISQLDLAECEQCAPSYRLLPASHPRQVSADRTELGKLVLNDDWASVPSGSERFKQRTSNKYEKVLFSCQDEQYECDMFLDTMTATANQVGEYLLMLKGRNLEVLPPVEKFLSVLHQKCIKQLYGIHAQDFLEMVKENPALALPVILSRLLEKVEEWRKSQEEMKTVWSQRYKDYFHLSLDHLSLNENCKEENLEASASGSGSEGCAVGFAVAAMECSSGVAEVGSEPGKDAEMASLD